MQKVIDYLEETRVNMIINLFSSAIKNATEVYKIQLYIERQLIYTISGIAARLSHFLLSLAPGDQ